jgi:hypothetical protein
MQSFAVISNVFCVFCKFYFFRNRQTISNSACASDSASS